MQTRAREIILSDAKFIPDDFVAQIINILASVVKHIDKGIKYIVYNSSVYNAMPKIFMEFANGLSGIRFLAFKAFSPTLF